MNEPKLGCLGSLLLVAVCSWPLHAIGLGDTASIIGGIVLSIVVLGFILNWHREARINEMREAQR